MHGSKVKGINFTFLVINQPKIYSSLYNKYIAILALETMFYMSADIYRRTGVKKLQSQKCFHLNAKPIKSKKEGEVL